MDNTGVMMSIHSTLISKRLEFRVELGLLNQNVCRDGKPEGRKKTTEEVQGRTLGSL